MTVSLVIPNYNGHHLLEKNLPSVIQACESWGGKYDIIIVDDASTDNSVSWLKTTYPRVKIVVNPKNLRFAKSINRGVAASKSDIVILLNNDVKPEPAFLKPLLSHFANPQVFAVGCLEENLSGGKRVLGGRGVGKFSRGLIMHQRAKDQSRMTTLWVAAGSGAFRRSLWQKLDGLDSLFRPAYEEDRDLCYTALKSGYKLIFEPRSQVTHIHETTNVKVFGPTKIKIISFKNQFLFVWKNISSPKLVFNHLVWLPYHLFITNLRTGGVLVLGFLAAILQLPQVLKSRSQVKRFWRLTDEQVLVSHAQ